MRRLAATGLLALGLPLGATLVAAAPALDPFYASQLRDGELLADQGKSAAAVKSLRIACFGMLEQPNVLARCLVRLGLAQAQSSDAAGFRQTFSRLLELESREPTYGAADIAPPIRSAFEEQVAQRIPGTILAASPTFQKLATESGGDGKDTKRNRKEAARAKAAPETTGAEVQAAQQTSSAPPVPQPAPAGAEPAVPAPPPAPAPAAKNPSASAAIPESSTPPVHPAPTAAPPAATTGKPASPPPARQAMTPSVPTAEESAALAAARAQMQGAKLAADLLAAADTARKVADAHPTSVEANALAGEIFYRSSRWQAAALYLKRSGPPPGQPLLGFYLAVAQFESGDRDGAATTLRPLLGKLQHTPYVQGYIQKILPP